MKWIGSPNFDTNRKTIDRVVIHWMAGTLSGTDSQFQKPKGTSAHYGIENGEIHQYVKEENVAYHAGVYAMNQRSIGIEHSAAPDRPATEETYQTSGKLVAEICHRHKIPIDREHIIKHSEVKATQCPGTIDMDKIIKIAKGVYMPDNPDWLIKNSDSWIGVLAYLEIQKPNPTLDDVKDVVAGIKARASDMEKQKGYWEAECHNREEQVGRLKDQLTTLENEKKACQTAQNNAEGKAKFLQGQVDAMAVEKGKLNIEIAELKSKRPFDEKLRIGDLFIGKYKRG